MAFLCNARRGAALALVLCASPAAAQQEQGGDALVSGMRVETACDRAVAGNWNVAFVWDMAGRAQQMRIEVTPYFNGFETERYETIAQLRGGVDRFEWSAGDPGAEYLWRVVALSGGSWRASEPARVVIPVCPVDYIDPKLDEREQETEDRAPPIE